MIDVYLLVDGRGEELLAELALEEVLGCLWLQVERSASTRPQDVLSGSSTLGLLVYVHNIAGIPKRGCDRCSPNNGLRLLMLIARM